MKHIQDSDADTDSEHRIPRRTLLKLLAGAPLALPFAFSASPLMRFLKPTTQKRLHTKHPCGHTLVWNI